MPSKSQFWCIFNGFLEGKWRHVVTKIKENLIQIAKSDFLINRALAAAGAWFLRVQGLKLASKINQKSIKNWSPRWIASWHRFLVDFDGFWEASWGGKSSQERKKSIEQRIEKIMKNRCVLEAPRTGHGDAGILGPPNYQFSKKTPHHSPQTKEHLVTPCAQARWRIHIYIYIWRKDFFIRNFIRAIYGKIV